MISTALALLETDEQRNILSEFYQKYKNRFYAIAYSKLHGKAAAEDAVQEAFLRIVDKPENFFKIEHNKRVAYADVIVRNNRLMNPYDQPHDENEKATLRSMREVESSANMFYYTED